MTFNIGSFNYAIRLSDHAKLRLSQRNIDEYQVMSAITALGKDRLEHYSDGTRDIMIQDRTNGFSVVIAIEKCTIYVITVIDNSDCFVKSGTTVIKI